MCMLGCAQEDNAHRDWTIAAETALAYLGNPEFAFVDLRENSERKKHGVIPGSLHAPYHDLIENVHPGGMLYELAAATSKRLLFYCAFGERSAMAVRATHGAGLKAACHLKGGIDAWKKAGGAVTK